MNAKKAFQKSPYRAKFEAISQDEAFRAALDAALLTMVQSQPREKEVTASWDCHSQLVGARAFIDILCSLHVPQKENKPQPWENLKPAE